MRFDVKNISGTAAAGHIHIVGSGGLRSPWQENDWLRTNFALFNLGGVHFGYLVGAIRVFRALRNWISIQDEILVTGHSLGGAVAEVLGVLIARTTGKSVRIENYGGPAPWGKKGLMRWVAAATPVKDAVWFVCGNDVVPFAMPWNTHLGAMRWIPGISVWPWKNHISGYRELIET